MSASLPIKTAGRATTLHSLALAISAGDLSAWPKTDWPLWEDADKQSAADELLHEDNPFEMARMIQRQADHDDFKAWQGRDYERRQYQDFDNWLDDRAMWRRVAA